MLLPLTDYFILFVTNETANFSGKSRVGHEESSHYHQRGAANCGGNGRWQVCGGYRQGLKSKFIHGSKPDL